MNVILTSVSLAGVGWFTGVLSEIHQAMFGEPIRWRYEISKLEATRERRPLPRGWNTVWDAEPEILVKRGYDKVICLQRPFEDLYEAHSWYNRRASGEAVKKMYPRLFEVIRRRWERFETEFEHPNYLKLYLPALNKYTVQEFTKVMDFLGFPKENRPILIPIKVERDWEVYGKYHQTEHIDDHLKVVKEARDNAN